MVFTKRNIFEFALSVDSRPSHSDFNQICLSWILELFPLSDFKKVKDFVKGYFRRVSELWDKCKSVDKIFTIKKYKKFWNTPVIFDDKIIPDPATVKCDHSYTNKEGAENSLGAAESASEGAESTESTSSSKESTSSKRGFSDETVSFHKWHHQSPKKRAKYDYDMPSIHIIDQDDVLIDCIIPTAVKSPKNFSDNIDITNLDDFLKYCCPKCPFTSEDRGSFQTHLERNVLSLHYEIIINIVRNSFCAS